MLPRTGGICGRLTCGEASASRTAPDAACETCFTSSITTLEATQRQISSQSPTESISGRWLFIWSCSSCKTNHKGVGIRLLYGPGRRLKCARTVLQRLQDDIIDLDQVLICKTLDFTDLVSNQITTILLFKIVVCSTVA